MYNFMYLFIYFSSTYTPRSCRPAPRPQAPRPTTLQYVHTMPLISTCLCTATQNFKKRLSTAFIDMVTFYYNLYYRFYRGSFYITSFFLKIDGHCLHCRVVYICRQFRARGYCIKFTKRFEKEFRSCVRGREPLRPSRLENRIFGSTSRKSHLPCSQ